MTRREKSMWRYDIQRTEALFDPTGTYRYTLLREWDRDGRRCCFIMLNPSTADAEKNDPTVRRCIGFAQRWGYGSLEVVNLFAYRSTSPALLGQVDDPIGPENDAHIDAAVARASLVVAAWGVHGAFLDRGCAVASRLREVTQLRCLGMTKQFHPKHPLYVPCDMPLIDFCVQTMAPPIGLQLGRATDQSTLPALLPDLPVPDGRVSAHSRTLQRLRRMVAKQGMADPRDPSWIAVRPRGGRDMDPKFIINLSGKEYCLYSGILDVAHERGLQGIETELIQIPSDDNGNTAIAKAVVRMKDGSVFEEFGDASPRNVNARIQTALIRMSLTRAKGRALRDAINHGATMFEELPDLDETAPVREAVAQKPASNGPPPGYTETCSGVRCGVRISEAQAKSTRERFGNPYCERCVPARGPEAAPQSTPTPADSEPVCSEPGCGVLLTKGQLGVSMAKFGAALCPHHQRERL